MGRKQNLGQIRPHREFNTMRKELHERGFIKVFLVLAILALLVFAGISFGTPYYRYFTLSARTADILKGEVGSNTQFVHGKVVELASDLNIPLGSEDVSVSHDGRHNKITVKATWTETVDLLGLYSHELNFDMKEEL